MCNTLVNVLNKTYGKVIEKNNEYYLITIYCFMDDTTSDEFGDFSEEINIEKVISKLSDIHYSIRNCESIEDCEEYIESLQFNHDEELCYILDNWDDIIDKILNDEYLGFINFEIQDRQFTIKHQKL